MPIGLKGNTDGSGAVQIGGSDAISISTGLNTTFAGTITASGGVMYPLTSGTAIASTSGTAIDFTSIPSWVKRITVMFSGVSTNGTSLKQIQLGDSGGFESTGYLSTNSSISASAAAGALATTGFVLRSGLAADLLNGTVVLTLLSSTSNLWTCFGAVSDSVAVTQAIISGSKSLSDTLTQVRITTVNGTDTFDAGSINILFE
jgi:hypothetical protein